MLQGTGKFMRHVKLAPGIDVDAPALRRLIRGRVPGHEGLFAPASAARLAGLSGSVANLHVAFAVLSLAPGLRIFTTRRGTPTHRKLGHGYITSMLVMNAAALLLFARTGAFGPSTWPP